MFSRKSKTLVVFVAMSTLFISGIASLTFAMPSSQTCEACGMTVAADSQEHLKIADSNAIIHYVECFKCALKLLKAYSELNITATCDWYGPSNIISVYLKDKINTTIVNPASALFIDGSCTKNRIVYDQTAADALLTNNGTSQYITMMQNVTITANSTQMSIAQAASLYAFTSSPDPTPTPTPSPFPSPTSSPTPASTTQPLGTPTSSSFATPIPTSTLKPSLPLVTQTCEACGMEVPPDAQQKYMITDASGTLRYAECFMCALNLCRNCDQLSITTYCDWYGSNYSITVLSSNFGKEVTVIPSTALFLNGGSCVINRAAYNQTAADMLLADGYSDNTLVEQHYALPSNTKVSTIAQVAVASNQNKEVQNPSPISFTLLIGIVAGIAVISLSLVAYYKFNSTKTKAGKRLL